MEIELFSFLHMKTELFTLTLFSHPLRNTQGREIFCATRPVERVAHCDAELLRCAYNPNPNLSQTLTQP